MPRIIFAGENADCRGGCQTRGLVYGGSVAFADCPEPLCGDGLSREILGFRPYPAVGRGFFGSVLAPRSVVPGRVACSAATAVHQRHAAQGLDGLIWVGELLFSWDTASGGWMMKGCPLGHHVTLAGPSHCCNQVQLGFFFTKHISTWTGETAGH